jgi:rhodanese-related sulfurtransferase
MKKLVFLLLTLSFLSATPIFAASVPTMDKDELKSLLGSDNLVILDVRTGRDWSSSEFKIENSVRMADSDLSIIEKYPKESTLVLYCA